LLEHLVSVVSVSDLFQVGAASYQRKIAYHTHAESDDHQAVADKLGELLAPAAPELIKLKPLTERAIAIRKMLLETKGSYCGRWAERDWSGG
jgi:hypothetical protein